MGQENLIKSLKALFVQVVQHNTGTKTDSGWVPNKCKGSFGNHHFISFGRNEMK
jgi:hypothetical protein